MLWPPVISILALLALASPRLRAILRHTLAISRSERAHARLFRVVVDDGARSRSR